MIENENVGVPLNKTEGRTGEIGAGNLDRVSGRTVERRNVAQCRRLWSLFYGDCENLNKNARFVFGGDSEGVISRLREYPNYVPVLKLESWRQSPGYVHGIAFIELAGRIVGCKPDTTVVAGVRIELRLAGPSCDPTLSREIKLVVAAGRLH